MDRLAAYAEDGSVRYEAVLVKEGRPTPLFLGLLVAELAIDISIGCIAFLLLGKRAGKR